MMECPSCKAANPDGKRYCSDCGASLSELDEEFRRKVQSIFREQLRDQKMVEIETFDAVLLRLKTWAKPFLYATGILAAVLGLLGFRSIRDTLDGLKAAQQQGLQALRQQAATETQSLAQEADTIRSQLRKVGDQKDLLEKQHQAEARLVAYEAAGKKLMQRYEVATTELAKRRIGADDSKVSSNIGNTLGSGSTPREASHYYGPGSSGRDVEKIQERLREVGCFHGAVDGTFDAGTKAAVERFNTVRGELFGGGVIDPATWTALFDKNPARCR